MLLSQTGILEEIINSEKKVFLDTSIMIYNICKNEGNISFLDKFMGSLKYFSGHKKDRFLHELKNAAKYCGLLKNACLSENVYFTSFNIDEMASLNKSVNHRMEKIEKNLILQSGNNSSSNREKENMRKTVLRLFENYGDTLFNLVEDSKSNGRT
ncbi:MAG: hypothetical protein WC475_05110, partial [Candidatus Paceibacterota bacterium]